jgi:type II secretory pathway pseudopilin PulG
MKANIQQQKGFGLTEALLVLGIGAAVMAGVFKTYQAVDQTSSLHMLGQDVHVLVSNIESGIGSTQSYNDLSAQAIADSNLLPASFEYADGAIQSQWGEVEVAPWGANKDGLTITFNNVPEKGCMQFVMGLESIATQLRVNGQLVGSNGGVTIEAATAACVGGGVVVLNHYQGGYGLKAGWETWS